MSEADYKPTDEFHKNCEQLQIDLDAADLEKLTGYLTMLLETNKQFNLTAIKEPGEAWQRHILDSLSMLPFLQDGKRIADVGSGGGLPGLVLACVMPDHQFTSIEATGKKARFQQETAEKLGLENFTVVNDRAEIVGQDDKYRERFDIVTARAVGRLQVLLEYMAPLVRVDGYVMAMKGNQAEVELRDAGDAMMKLGLGEVQVFSALPEISEDAVVIAIEKVSPTEKEFPRNASLIKGKPL